MLGIAGWSGAPAPRLDVLNDMASEGRESKNMDCPLLKFAMATCPCGGGRMLIVETFQRGRDPKYRPTTAPFLMRIDTS